MILLEVENLTKRFGGLTAVQDVSFSVGSGEILGLIGPNGAGKSTCINLITGVIPAGGGRLIWRGENIRRLRTHEIARRGLVRTFQQTSIFPMLTVSRNVAAACYLRTRSNPLDALLFNRRYREDIAAIGVQTDLILREVGLSDHAGRVAADLAYGHLRRLGVAVALAAQPQLLLMDEPVAGLNPTESAEFVTLVRRVRDSGVTILLVEHDMRVVMGLCDRIVVLNEGMKLAEGTPAAIQANQEVIVSYMGNRRQRVQAPR